GIVDTTKAGKYEVIYGYQGVESKALITVKADQTTVKVHDSELYTGGNWTGKDNFDSATDRDGKPVDFEDINATGTVDTTKAGKYEVTYSYHGIESKALITVKADQTSLNVHDSTMDQGDEWQPETNFDSATDRDGEEVAYSEVEVQGKVNTDKIGQYMVSYQYGAVTARAVITVQAKVSQAPNETPPTEAPETDLPEEECPETEIPETEESNSATEEPIQSGPETGESETAGVGKNENGPSEQSNELSATGRKPPLKESTQQLSNCRKQEK
ncbi:bacterial Ig-like domain-containing protein, partial [Enterococcus entomosocium]